MSSQYLPCYQSSPTPQLDGHIKGIRDEFDRLNHELEEARKQRDEYITNYRNQVEELRKLRQTISDLKDHQFNQGTAHADDNPSPLISPVSSTSDYYFSLEEEEGAASDELDDTECARGESNRSEISVERTVARSAPLSLVTSDNDSAWDVELASNTTAELNLNLVHKLTLEGKIRVAFSMDGKLLAAASRGIVSIFESKTGKRISVMKDLYEKSLPRYTCLGFSPDGKFLATGDVHGKVQIWIISQRRVRNIFRDGHRVYALNFSPNGHCIATCSWGGTVRTWRLRDGFSRVLTSFQFSAWSVRFTQDGRYIASGCHFAPQILIWTVRTGKLVARWQGRGTSLVFTPDGNGLLGSSMGRQVIHWDVAFLRSLGLADPLISNMREISSLTGHTGIIDTLSISPDGKWIASGSSDQTVRLWNAHDATLHCILHCPGRVLSVDFSPVGNYLAIAGAFGEITIWKYSNL